MGLGGVTIVGKSNLVTASEMIEENTAIATATNQDNFALKVKQANLKSAIAGSVDTRFYVVPALTSYVKN